MDLKQIKQIIELMKRSELTEFAIEEEGFKLKIRRGNNGLPVVSGLRGSNSPFATGDTTPPIPLQSSGSTPDWVSFFLVFFAFGALATFLVGTQAWISARVLPRMRASSFTKPSK